MITGSGSVGNSPQSHEERKNITLRKRQKIIKGVLVISTLKKSIASGDTGVHSLIQYSIRISSQDCGFAR